MASVRSDETSSPASEDDCTICMDEIRDDPIYAYDHCFGCQKTERLAQVCRYTDISNSIRSMGSTYEELTTVGAEVCCANANGDASLLTACAPDTSSCIGKGGGLTFKRTDGDIIY